MKEGAKIIHVDPRFTRTSAMADIWVPLRAGSDILFLGAMMNYVLQNTKEFREYVERYTNASTILREEFRDPGGPGRIFLRVGTRRRKQYDPQIWLYEGSPKKGEVPLDQSPAIRQQAAAMARTAEARPAIWRSIETDPTLQHPRCVFQVLKRHFSRYTPELVEQYCGVPQEAISQSRRGLLPRLRARQDRAICYAVGWTQHSKGVQIIRAAAILQLLLGNIGRPGGGILALRGHASIQGSTDIPTLYDILPGYLPDAVLRSKDANTLKDYIAKHSVARQACGRTSTSTSSAC